MGSVRSGREGWATSNAAARGVLFAYLACSLVSRVADANPHDGLWHVPWVIACYLLPVWYLSGRVREPWQRAPWALLAVQAVVTFVPLVSFGSHWVGGVDGLLGALVLLVMRSRMRWGIFALLAVIELVAWSAAGFPYQPPVNAGTWVVVAFLNVGLGVFGMALAVTVLERLESTAEMLADRAVDRERLATARGLQTAIISRLEEVRRRADAALLTTGEATAIELQRMGAAARQAAASARRLASALPGSSSPMVTEVDEVAVSPAAAYRVAGAVVILFSLQYLANTIVPAVGGAEAAPPTDVAAIVVALAMIALQLHHSRPRNAPRPRGWGWTLAAQVVLCFALYPVFGVVSMNFLAFVGGSALLLIALPVRWLAFGAAVGVLPVLTLLSPADVEPSLRVQWTIYACATNAAASLLIFGLGRFARATAELADAHREIAQAAATRERVRIARDTHDTLGLALSTIALKSDLAQALMSRDAARARREIVQAMHLAHTVTADAESIITGTLHLKIASELATARDALRAAGIKVTIDGDTAAIPGPIETQLAAVLREAIANVLRHSDARSCTIRIGEVGGEFIAEVTNDGLRAGVGETRDGHGLSNIRSRVAALGGTVDVNVHDDRFSLATRLPATTAARAGTP